MEGKVGGEEDREVEWRRGVGRERERDRGGK